MSDPFTQDDWSLYDIPTWNGNKALLTHKEIFEDYQRAIDQRIQELHASQIYIPKDPQEFMNDFGPLYHPNTGKPTTILTAYQYEWWKAGWQYHYREAIKSNKIGLTTSNLLEMGQHGLLDCAGYEMLIFAQTHDMAKDHLKTLRQLFTQSEKYSQFMITKAKDYLLKDDVTKVTELFLENPYNKYRKTSIKALSMAAGSSVSWKNVKYILCSDITMSGRSYDETLSGAFTRLANTEGYITIETIPNGPIGEVYRIWRESRLPTERSKAISERFKWFVREYPYTFGVQAGLISQDFIDAERFNQGKRFSQKYECSFDVGVGNVFTPQQVANMKILGKQYSTIDPYQRIYPKAMGIDPQSEFAIVITCQVDGNIITVYSDKEEDPDWITKVKQISRLMHQYQVTKIYADASNRDFIRTLSKRLGYPIDPETKNVNEWSDLSRFGLFTPVNWGTMEVEMLTHMQGLASRGILGTDEDQHPELMADFTSAQESRYKLINKNSKGNTYDLLEAYEVQLLNYRSRARAIQ